MTKLDCVLAFVELSIEYKQNPNMNHVVLDTPCTYILNMLTVLDLLYMHIIVCAICIFL